MKKKLTTILILLIIILASLYLIPNLITKVTSHKSILKIKHNKLFSSQLPENNFKSLYAPKLFFSNMPSTVIHGITFNILSHKDLKDVPVLLKSQRYYISLNYLSKVLGFQINTTNNNINLKYSTNSISIRDNKYTQNSIEKKLRGGVISKFNENYLALSDIEAIFNLFAIFNFQENTISLYNSTATIPTQSDDISTKNIAFFRLEDFTAGDSYTVDKNQAKVKLMANYLQSNNIKFHVAWIPRFKAPTDNIDNDLLKNSSIENIGFINLLDYLINHGGEVGLHGYTHQSGDSRSAVGGELTKDTNTSPNEIKGIIENAMDTANALNIPVTFFESPHYLDTDSQQKIIAEYFQVLYEPKDYTNKYILKTNKNNIFVPTPLGFVENHDLSKILDNLKDKNSKLLKSFFYHPSIEMDYLDYTIENNTIVSSFHDDSPLKKIVQALNDYNYTTLHVSELTKDSTINN